MPKILDTHSLLVFFEKDVGFDKVKSLLVEAAQKGENLLLSSISFGEICNIVSRECGQEKANEIENIIKTLPIEIVDITTPLSTEAFRIKDIYKLSYPNCFPAALAKLQKGELVTGDKEFKKTERELKIEWIN
ncbi:MAG: type II toxin-antitoxin system VapC family toxin [bacterium]|nr:type II toxin-antitoxin system VapC family toxin [bacterium]